MITVCVSVVIPVLNESGLIESAIEHAWSAGAAEVVVVDGGSQDGTAELAKQSRCVLVHSAAGRARQQNAGAAIARGEWLLFLHVDCRLEPDAITRAVSQLNRLGKHWGAFRQQIAAPGWGLRLIEWGNRQRIAWLGVPYGDQAICVQASLFRECGGFPDVPILEDLLLSRALRRRQWPAVLKGPLHVDARRWKQRGVLRQTLRNWRILAAWKLGARPERLVGLYPRHDQS